MTTSIERRLCGCVYGITWGTDGESLLSPCVAHADPASARENLIGRVGVCSRGRPGLITARKELPWGLSWVGIGLDDGTPWSSRSPRVMGMDELVALAEAKVPAEFKSAPPAPVTSAPEVWTDEEDDVQR